MHTIRTIIFGIIAAWLIRYVAVPFIKGWKDKPCRCGACPRCRVDWNKPS